MRPAGAFVYQLSREWKEKEQNSKFFKIHGMGSTILVIRNPSCKNTHCATVERSKPSLRDQHNHSRGAAEWVRNKFWPLWWRKSLSIKVQKKSATGCNTDILALSCIYIFVEYNYERSP